MQRQAALWEKQGLSNDLLLRGEALSEAEDWADKNPQEMSEIERTYLQASLLAAEEEDLKRIKQEQRLSAERQRSKRLRKLSIIMLLIFIPLLITAVVIGYLTAQVPPMEAKSFNIAVAEAIANSLWMSWIY